jgi:ribonuclease HI
LASTKWGADQDTLLNIHKTVVLSTLRYGEEIYGSANERDLAQIEATNNKGIRAALGAFCVTKTTKLLEEAGFTTVGEMRKFATLKKAIKIGTNTNHPLEPITKQTIDKYTKQTQPKPLIVRAIKVLQTNDLNLQNIEKNPKFQIAPWEEGVDKYIDLQMMEVRNAANKTKQDRFKEIINDYDEHHILYTDGSKTTNACGYAVVTTDTTLIAKRIPDIASIYTAEIRAIIQAIRSNQHQTVPTIICSDSMSAIMASQNKNTKEAAAIKLANLIYSGKGKIKLMWTPSHAGIEGNELADTAAKLSLNSPIDFRETIAEIDLVTYLRTKLMPKHREKSSGMSRKQQVAVSRINMGYTRLTHRHRIERTQNPICDTCNTDLTVDHLMKVCSKYQIERITSGLNHIYNQQQQNQQYTISTAELRERILIFLETTGIIDDI